MEPKQYIHTYRMLLGSLEYEAVVSKRCVARQVGGGVPDRIQRSETLRCTKTLLHAVGCMTDWDRPGWAGPGGALRGFADALVLRITYVRITYQRNQIPP